MLLIYGHFAVFRVAAGESGCVLGIDVSQDLLTFAASHNERPWVAFRHGDAAALDLQDVSFDRAVMAQVLEYVADADACLSGLHRVLRPGGRLVVIDTDWDGVIWHTSDVDRLRRIKFAWEEHCADPRLPRTLLARLRSAGFGPVTVTGFPIINTRFDPSVLSYGLVGLMSDFLERRQTVAARDLEEWVADLEALDRQGRYFFSLLRCVFIASRA